MTTVDARMAELAVGDVVRPTHCGVQHDWRRLRGRVTAVYQGPPAAGWVVDVVWLTRPGYFGHMRTTGFPASDLVRV